VVTVTKASLSFNVVGTTGGKVRDASAGETSQELMQVDVGKLTSFRYMSYYVCMSKMTSSPEAAFASPEKRQHLRFDKVFPVRVESVLFGELPGVARNVSAGGIFIEMREPLPLGSRVRVSFCNPDETAEIVAIGEVKNHYFMNYVQAGATRSVSGMAVRFEGFENESRQILEDCLNRFRILN
jgi:hypothetical protein